MMKDWIQHEDKWSVQTDADLPVVLNRGQGVWLWDIEGRRYLDMNSACATLNYGYCHPKILGAFLKTDTIVSIVVSVSVCGPASLGVFVK